MIKTLFETNILFSLLTNFGLYKCKVRDKMVMGFVKANHEIINTAAVGGVEEGKVMALSTIKLGVGLIGFMERKNG